MALIKTISQSYYNYQNKASYGGYQFISLEHIINQFIVAYVGEDKIISKIKKLDVSFHAQRALQELSFDTLKSVKSIEVEIPPSLSLILPQDYVNYVKLAWSDSAGIEHIIYPTSKTSNPFAIKQNTNGTYDFDYNDDSIEDLYDIQHQNTIRKSVASIAANTTTITLNETSIPNQSNLGGVAINDNTFDLEVGMYIFHSSFPYGTKISAIDNSTATLLLYPNGGIITLDQPSTNSVINTLIPSSGEIVFSKDFSETSDTLRKFKNQTAYSSDNNNSTGNADNIYSNNQGNRYGIDPQHAQANGSYFIDEQQGRVYFSSAISGKTVVLKYISDSLGTDEEMKVHKFAEEAMYKCIAYAIMSTRANVQEYVVRRFQKDKFAAVRKAKLRLSSLKLEELTQILRGKSKQIKH